MSEKNLTQEDIVKIMRDERFVMLATVNEDGSLHSQPMTPQEVTDDAAVYFFISSDTEPAHQLQRNPQANLAFAEAGSWLSVSGTVSFLEGEELRTKVDELWNNSAEAWFSGKTDPTLAVIRFDGDSAQFWGSRGGRVGALLDIAKARLTGQRPSGASQEVDL